MGGGVSMSLLAEWLTQASGRQLLQGLSGKQASWHLVQEIQFGRLSDSVELTYRTCQTQLGIPDSYLNFLLTLLPSIV